MSTFTFQHPKALGPSQLRIGMRIDMYRLATRRERLWKWFKALFAGRKPMHIYGPARRMQVVTEVDTGARVITYGLRMVK